MVHWKLCTRRVGDPCNEHRASCAKLYSRRIPPFAILLWSNLNSKIWPIILKDHLQNMGKSLGKGPISPTKVSSLLLLRLRQLLSQDLLHALLLLDEEGAHDALAHAAPWCEPGDNVGPKMRGSSTWGTRIGSESCQKIIPSPYY